MPPSTGFAPETWSGGTIARGATRCGSRSSSAPSPSRSCTVGTERCGPVAVRYAPGRRRGARAIGRLLARLFGPASSVAAPPDANVFLTVSGSERFVASLRDDSSGDAGLPGASSPSPATPPSSREARTGSATGTRCREPGPGSRAARLARRVALAAERTWVVAAIAAGLLAACLQAPRARRFVYLGGDARLCALAVRPQPLRLAAKART